ncbi:MAG: hypothetical protein JXA45_04680, partial [Methanomassiliicoccales archaeon]|nr:hypothetical protein [Methanomassiliicoccales archaeon]
VVMLWKRKEDQELTEDAYERLMMSTVTMGHRARRYASSLELIIENQDGSYEFIPYMADAHRSASRAH